MWSSQMWSKNEQTSPTATAESYPPYFLLVSYLILDRRFVEQNKEIQDEILEWVEFKFFNYLNEMRSKGIKTNHAKKKQMFWTLAGIILDKYISDPSSNSDASDASDNEKPVVEIDQLLAEEECSGQSFNPYQRPPIPCDRLTMFEVSISQVIGGSFFCGDATATCANGEIFFAWEVNEPPTDPSNPLSFLE
jgi:hypothetical protein